MQKCKELCGRSYDYVDGLPTKSVYGARLKRHRHFALFSVRAMHCDTQSILIST